MSTLIAKHNAKIDKIENSENEKQHLIEEKNKLEMKASHENSLTQKLQIESKIYDIKKKIELIEKDSLTAYLLKLSPIMFEMTNNNEVKTNEVSDNKDYTNMNSFVEQIQCNNRGSIYSTYMSIFENKPKSVEKIQNSYVCHKCNISKLICPTESLIICPICSDNEIYFDTSANALTYEQELNTDTNVHFAYKRINHFRELLNQLQAKESVDVPSEVIEDLRNEFKKSRIKSISDITHIKVKSFLKKLKYNKYYENTNQITNILTGSPPPIISDYLYEKLITMFMEIQEPFERSCPKNRKNFLSYNYVLYKFCELFDEKEIMKHFPLLKSREKLYQQDCIWKQICVIKDWRYYPSV